MNIKRSVSVILAAFCLTAGANIFTANAATVSPEGIAASENVGASKDDQIKDLKAQLADLENRYYYLQNELQDTEENYQYRLRMLEEELMAAENKYKTNNTSLTTQVDNLKKTVSEYKAQSEAANYKYEAFLNDIQRLDANGDNKIDATDASMLLSIYAYNSTNKTPVTTISDYYKKTS